MLFVLFHLGKDRYALEAGRVVEIVPLLALKKFPQSPRGLAGMFIYRGRPVPALDLCELTLGRPAVEQLSTRILIVNYGPPPGAEQLIGLIAERATETIRRDLKEFVTADGQVAAPPFLGPMLTDEHGVIQLINPEKIMQERAQTLLFAPPTEADHAPD